MLWRFYTVPGDPSKPFEAPILEQAAKTWTRRVVEARRRRHGLGLDGLRPRARPALHRHRQRLAVEPAASAARAAATTCSSARSSRCKPDTGEYVWHYQTTPGETWDYTATQHIMLADLTIDGQPRKVLMQAPKNGFFYVLDRTNGKLISAKPFAPVNWATGDRPEDGPAGRESGGALHESEAAVRCVMPGPLRRAQLASDVVQPADRARLHARAGAGHGVPARPEVQAQLARLQHRHRRRPRS